MYSDDQGYGYNGGQGQGYNEYYYGGYGNGGQGYDQYNQPPPQQQYPPGGGGRQNAQPQGAYAGQGDSGFFNPGMMPPGMNNFNPMISTFAKQYGETLVGQGKEIVDEKIQKFVTVSKLKYYFAVDTAYVMKKMGLLFFPFTHKDWSIHYDKNEDDAVQPRYEVNAPDLYIPLMAFITYILVAGVSLGMQQKFSPEFLGMQASSALGWLLLELMIFTGFTYVIQTDLKVFDLLTFCGYKFVGMLSILIASLFLKKTGYYAVLLYFSLSLSFFLVQTLKKQIYSVTTHEHVMTGNKRRLYFLLALAGVQPVLMGLLTYHLAVW
ncbi:unnamed protein product [Orchesella dallaii]|uniref:Protein YIF1 n=1 Tax=Orchesella dallaii TaxID=48710 RepID=A0ABP1PX44_9HEXA